MLKAEAATEWTDQQLQSRLTELAELEQLPSNEERRTRLGHEAALIAFELQQRYDLPILSRTE